MTPSTLAEQKCSRCGAPYGLHERREIEADCEIAVLRARLQEVERERDEALNSRDITRDCLKSERTLTGSWMTESKRQLQSARAMLRKHPPLDSIGRCLECLHHVSSRGYHAPGCKWREAMGGEDT